VRVMADGAGNSHIVIIGQDQRVLTVQQRFASGTGMATTATVDIIRVAGHGLKHVRHHGAVRRCGPVLITKPQRMPEHDRGRGELIAVATAADLGGQVHTRYDRLVARIGRMIGGRPVAILALHAFQLGGKRRVGKSGRYTVTHRVTGQTS